MIRKLKAKQRGPKCSYCLQQADWRGIGFGKFSCHNHKPDLAKWDERECRPDYSFAAFHLEYVGP